MKGNKRTGLGSASTPRRNRPTAPTSPSPVHSSPRPERCAGAGRGEKNPNPNPNNKQQTTNNKQQTQTPRRARPRLRHLSARLCRRTPLGALLSRRPGLTPGRGLASILPPPPWSAVRAPVAQPHGRRHCSFEGTLRLRVGSRVGDGKIMKFKSRAARRAAAVAAVAVAVAAAVAAVAVVAVVAAAWSRSSSLRLVFRGVQVLCVSRRDTTAVVV